MKKLDVLAAILVVVGALELGSGWDRQFQPGRLNFRSHDHQFDRLRARRSGRRLPGRAVEGHPEPLAGSPHLTRKYELVSK